MKLELQGFRAVNCGPLKDVCIDFRDAVGNTRPVIVLGGANGTGKTTVLEVIVALSAYLHPRHGGPSDILRRTEYAQIDWLVDGERFSIYHGILPSNVQFEHPYLATSPDPSVASGTYGKYLSDLIERQESKALVFPQGEPQFKFPSLLYFPNARIISPVSTDLMYRAEVLYHWIHKYVNIREFKESLDSYLVWLEFTELDTYSRVVDYLNALDFEGKSFSIDRKALKTTVKLRNGHEHFLEELSSGEQNVLIMLLELRRRLLPYSIVLIDEIENSLHPAYQHKLAQALLKMQIQIPFQLIVTTHSIAFVEAFGAECLRVLGDF